MWFMTLGLGTAWGTPAATTALGAVPADLPVDAWSVVGVHPRGGPADADGYGPRGALVQLRPTIDGVAVDASMAVVLESDGAVRRIRAATLPNSRATGPTVSEEIAVAAALATGAGADPRARLSWQRVGQALRQVWTVDLTASAEPDIATPRVRVDAVSGRVLSVTEGASHTTVPLARAFPNNPVVDGEAVEVALPWATDTLSDDQVVIEQCRDEGEFWLLEVDEASYALRTCTPSAPAPAQGGNFFHEPQSYPDDPALDEDEFAGPHTYWNLHQGLDWFASLGWTPRNWLGAPDEALVARVNYRVYDPTSEETAGDPEGPLAPYNNAYFSGSYSSDASTLVFGQGDQIDYAYDADVIHHELGHYVVYTQGGLLFSQPTPFGPSLHASTLNEGLADYFSSAIQEDADLGEYAAADRTTIRDVSGPETCADSLFGESHYDSLPFSTALWAVRSDLDPADRLTFDQAVLEGIAEIGFEASLETAVDVMVDQATDALGEDVGADLSRAFDDRGFPDCIPRIDAPGGPDPVRLFSLVAPAYPWMTTTVMPGYVQYRVEIPPGGATIRLDYAQIEFLGFDPTPDEQVPLEIVGKPGHQVRWTREEMEVENYGYIFIVDEWSTVADEIGVPEETGTRPHADNPLYQLHDYTLSWTVVEPGAYTFQFTNDTEQSAIIYEPTVQITSLLVAPPEATPRACGCGTPGPMGGAWLVVGLGLLWRRRWPSMSDQA